MASTFGGRVFSNQKCYLLYKGHLNYSVQELLSSFGLDLKVLFLEAPDSCQWQAKTHVIRPH